MKYILITNFILTLFTVPACYFIRLEYLAVLKKSIKEHKPISLDDFPQVKKMVLKSINRSILVYDFNSIFFNPIKRNDFNSYEAFIKMKKIIKTTIIIEYSAIFSLVINIILYIVL